MAPSEMTFGDIGPDGQLVIRRIPVVVDADEAAGTVRSAAREGHCRTAGSAFKGGRYTAPGREFDAITFELDDLRECESNSMTTFVQLTWRGSEPSSHELLIERIDNPRGPALHLVSYDGEWLWVSGWAVHGI